MNLTCFMPGHEFVRSKVAKVSNTLNEPPSQALYNVDLSEQIAGSEPVSGKPVTMSGNINALLIWNNAEKEVGFTPQNSTAYITIAR